MPVARRLFMDEAKRALAAALGLDDPERLPLVLDVPIAGKAAGLSRSRSYAAAADGSMPTIEIAGRKKVPRIAWLKKLAGEAA
jgi:hypothetical protein